MRSLAACTALMLNMRETPSQGEICTEIHQMIEILRISVHGVAAHSIIPLEPGPSIQPTHLPGQLMVCKNVAARPRLSSEAQPDMCIILDSIHSSA